MKICKLNQSILVILATLFLPTLLLTSPTYGEQIDSNKSSSQKASSLVDQLSSIEAEVDPVAWNGCVTLRRVKRIKFLDDQTALMSMRNRNPDRKKIILKLRRQCPGIKRNGYIHRASGQRLCVGFDRFIVMGSSGYSCRVESLEPYIDIEEPSLE
jgi:hypothetical protein